MPGKQVQPRQMMKLALSLARRGYGRTSPNPMVGAVLVKHGRVIGRGWHRQAGEPHAEIEALRDAERQGHDSREADLYVTLEPCSTFGRTPPCTSAIISAGIRHVFVGSTDPNPAHCGKGLTILKRAGIEVSSDVLRQECAALNESFNHWIVHRTPLVTVKAAMSLDGKIALRTGESKWITGPAARRYGMKLRLGADAILVGINTVLADDPSLTFREAEKNRTAAKGLRRIILDATARTPMEAKVVSDAFSSCTTIVVGKFAPQSRVRELSRRVNVVTAPSQQGRLNLCWLLKRLGRENVTSLLVEGGGEVNASFLAGGLAHHIAFFYASKVLGGRDSRTSVGGDGVKVVSEASKLSEVRWQKIGTDLLLLAKVSA